MTSKEIIDHINQLLALASIRQLELIHRIIKVIIQ